LHIPEASIILSFSNTTARKNANLENALLLISNSFNNKSISITQELLAAMMATLDKEVGKNYLPVEEEGDYGMGPGSTYTVGGSRRSTHYEGGVDYKGRGYIQITLKSNYQKYCPDCVGISTPELDICGCKNKENCTVTDPAICPQVKALKPERAADIFASYYINSPQGKNLVSLSNAKKYKKVGKAINANDTYVSEFNAKANDYLTFFSNNTEKTQELLIWLNSGTSVAVAATSIGTPITLTLYVHSGDPNGPIISDAQVSGQDGAGNIFDQTTDSNGYVTITGIPGTWSFSASAEGYEANRWDQEIGEDDTKNAFLLQEKISQQVSSGAELQRLVHDAGVGSISFSPDGSKLATASYKTARIWDVSSGEELQRMVIKGYNTWVASVSFSPDGTKIATTENSAYTARIWDVSNGSELQRLDDRRGLVFFSPDGSELLTATLSPSPNQACIIIWDVTSGEQLNGFCHDGSINSYSLSPDGSKVAVATTEYDDYSNRDCLAIIWDISNMMSAKWLIHDYNVLSVEFSPDSSKLATAGENDTVRIWDVSSEQEIQRLVHGYWVTLISFSPDGTKLVLHNINFAIFDNAFGVCLWHYPF
jgi:WD40 repeat protein